MLIARSLSDIPRQAASAVTIGSFDGVHRAHQSVIGALTARARELGCRSVLVTFDPHPRVVVRNEPMEYLTTLDERLERIAELGVDAALVIHFTFEFSRQSPREFYERYIVQGLSARHVIVGHDHMFGRDREAGTEELRRLSREFGFGLDVIPPVMVAGEIVGSSRIRRYLAAGNVEAAQTMLGRPYELRGRVIEGDRRGQTIGFPTANLGEIDPAKLIPAGGVYCVGVVHGGRPYYGMLNIGSRPTFGQGAARTIEVHIFDFHGTIYGDRLEVRFLRRLRAERTFASVEDLKQQLERDREESKSIVHAYSHNISS